ncbi:OTU domain-containing protein, partial [Streptomyces fructofermentans]
MPLNQRQIADVYHALTQHPDATFGAVYDWIRYTYADLLPHQLLILHQQHHQTIHAPTLSSLDFSKLPARTFLYMAAVEQIHREHGTIARVGFNATVTVFGEEAHVGRWLNSVRRSGRTSTIPARQHLLNEMTRMGMRWEILEMTPTDLLMKAVWQIYRDKGTIANVGARESVEIDGRAVPVGAWLHRVRNRGRVGLTVARQELLDELDGLGMRWEKIESAASQFMKAARQIYAEKGTIAGVSSGEVVEINGVDIFVGRWLRDVRARGMHSPVENRQAILDELKELGLWDQPVLEGDKPKRTRDRVTDDELTMAVEKFYSSNPPKKRISQLSAASIETVGGGPKKGIRFGKWLYTAIRNAKKDGRLAEVPEAVYEMLKKHGYSEIGHLKPRPAKVARTARGGGAVPPGPGRVSEGGASVGRVPAGLDVVSSLVRVRLTGGTDWQYWRVDHHADGTIGWWRPKGKRSERLPEGAEVLDQGSVAPAGGTVARRAVAGAMNAIPGDGDCLYHALCVALGRGNSKAAALGLRREILESFNGPRGEQIRQLAEQVGDLGVLRHTIGTAGEWAGGAGDLSPYVAANMLGVALHIHRTANTNIITPLTETDDGQPLPPPVQTLHLHLHNNHYIPLDLNADAEPHAPDQPMDTTGPADATGRAHPTADFDPFRSVDTNPVHGGRSDQWDTNLSTGPEFFSDLFGLLHPAGHTVPGVSGLPAPDYIPTVDGLPGAHGVPVVAPDSIPYQDIDLDAAGPVSPFTGTGEGPVPLAQAPAGGIPPGYSFTESLFNRDPDVYRVLTPDVGEQLVRALARARA